jgi:hypothetical protein
MSKKLISIKDAAAIGVQRLRKPVWANPLDHLKIDIINGEPGPWAHLWAPFNKECNGRDPVSVLAFQWDLSLPEFELYDGPLPDSEEYRNAVASFEGVLASGVARPVGQQ